MKIITILLFLAALIAASVASDDDDASAFAHHDLSIDQQQQVEVSPKCAAVLVASTTTVGMSAAYILIPAALCAAGFCPAGIASGSFASWWQSTMPLVASGSLFAQLQAMAMGGIGASNSIVVALGAVGGVVGATLLQSVCSFVDETDPDSTLGMSIAACEMAVTKAFEYKVSVQDKCASSETCTASIETIVATKNRVVDAVVEAKKRFLSSMYPSTYHSKGYW